MNNVVSHVSVVQYSTLWLSSSYLTSVRFVFPGICGGFGDVRGIGRKKELTVSGELLLLLSPPSEEEPEGGECSVLCNILIRLL